MKSIELYQELTWFKNFKRKGEVYVKNINYKHNEYCRDTKKQYKFYLCEIHKRKRNY